METIAVTGAAGALGRRVVHLLASDARVARVVTLDRVTQPPLDLTASEGRERIVSVRTDLRSGGLSRHFEGATTVVHLAEEPGRPDDSALTLAMLAPVLAGAAEAGVDHVVVLSSAMAYGAHPDNPVPLTESHPLRPVPALAYAVAKAALEEAALAWAGEGPGRRVAILRPTTTLAEHGAAWAARALRAAITVRPDQVDPPLQFLHYDDLASALALATVGRFDGAFNVAPDGWIGPDVFRDLVGGIQLRVPDRLNDRLLAVGRRVGLRPTPEGIEAYVRYPWVVANDALRRAGWTPSFSNSEAFVIGTMPPLWSVSAKQRQEIALTVAGLGLAGAAALAAGLTRRALR